MHHPTIHSFKHASWLEHSLQGPTEFRDLVDRIKALLVPLVDVPVIAVSGLSGLLVGPTVALETNRYLLVVRKLNEQRHSDNEVEGPRGNFNYVILDDFLQSGSTVVRIVECIARHTTFESHCAGVLSYRYNYREGKFESFEELQRKYFRIKGLHNNGTNNPCPEPSWSAEEISF